MKSYIILTDESEDVIRNVLDEFLDKEDYGEIIIFDNHSKDNTVPEIISRMGILWTDKKQRYKFYINKKKDDITTLREKGISIARYTPIIIECYEAKKKGIEKEGEKDVKNK